MSFNPKHRLPKTTDDEVKVFHPYFEDAINCALINLGIEKKYFASHHYTTNSGIVDYVIIKNDDNRVYLTVEIKRTTMSTRSSGRRQARDYYNNLGATMATKYYCSTNLELIELFRDDESKKATHTQQVLVENDNVGRFDIDSNDSFFNKLVLSLTEILSIVLKDDGKYLDKLTNIRSSLENRIDNIKDWHQFFIPTTFEYILGMSFNSLHLKKELKKLGWPTTVEKYKFNPNKILLAGAGLDFKQIFSSPAPSAGDALCFSSSVLNEAYNAGKASSLGEDIAELVNSILSPKGKGIVETDSELARLLAVVARDSLSRNLSREEIIFDPCAGSGRLLTSLEPGFKSVYPEQIWANEINERFKQPLTLRLGMSFINSINSKNVPKTTIGNITKISKEDCKNVKVVVINPPYLSGVECKHEKNELAKRIHELTTKNSQLNEGQIALEVVFLELVNNLIIRDTVVACILPIQHLIRQSKEVVKFRKFLLTGFGLTHIVKYPMEGLFSDVTKETVIVVGRKDCTASHIKLINIESSVANIDIDKLLKSLVSTSGLPIRGVNVSSIKRNVLDKQKKVGWRRLMGAGALAAKFIECYFTEQIELPLYENKSDPQGKIISRGTLANSGNARLAAIDPNDETMCSVLKLIPLKWRYKGLNSSKGAPTICNSNTLSEVAIFPPPDAYDITSLNYKTLTTIISEYLNVVTKTKKTKASQTKALKTCKEIILDLRKDQKLSNRKEILIPRATRRYARVCLLNESKAIISTNFLKIYIEDEITRKLFASWILSIFGQLQLELLATPQEGMRKLEVGTLANFLVPKIDTIDSSIAKELISIFDKELPLEFKIPLIRDTDKLWAKVLAPNNNTEILDEAFLIFEQLIEERAP